MRRELVFFLEERSAQVLLEGLLTRILPDDLPRRFIVFEGKTDLMNQLGGKLRGYRNPDARMIILRDKDKADCLALKAKIRLLCEEAGRPDTIIRIACHELESWYLADLAAVEKALGVTGIAHLQMKEKYRDPDHLSGPSMELKALVPSYQKVGGSRAIAAHLTLGNIRSNSFRVFVAAIKKTIEGG